MSYFSELDQERTEGERPFEQPIGGPADGKKEAGVEEEPSAFAEEDVQIPAAVSDPLPSGQAATVHTAPDGGTPQEENAGAQDAVEEDDAEKRQAHEAAEAKRKAEWDAKQLAKKQREEAAFQQLKTMSDQEVMKASMKRISTDTERLTRRNMKDCVSECIQTLCLEDPDFARMAMHPRKSMIHCIWYINRKAREFVQQEMKDNDLRPENGVYGSDVPDDLCYKWAEEYFRDPDAKEDQEEEEKFVPKPYVGKSRPRGKNKPKEKKEAVKKEAVKKPPKPVDDGQLTLGDLGELPEAG